MTPHNTVDAERLLPCPFCGGEPGFGGTAYGTSFVNCTECLAATGGALNDDRSDREMAAEAWNRRAARAEPQAVDAERLRALLREFRDYVLAHPGAQGLSHADQHFIWSRVADAVENIRACPHTSTRERLGVLLCNSCHEEVARAEPQDKAERVEAWWERMGWAGPIAMQWRTPLGDWSRWHDYSPDRQGDLVREGVEIRYAYPPATPPTGEDIAAAQDAVRRWKPYIHRGELYEWPDGEWVRYEDHVAALAQRPAAPREGTMPLHPGEFYCIDCGRKDCAHARHAEAITAMSPREGVRGSGEAVGHVTARGGIRWTSRAIPRTGTALYTRSEDARDGEDAARYRALRRGRPGVHGDCYAMVFAGDDDYLVKGVELDCLTDRMIRRAARTQEGK